VFKRKSEKNENLEKLNETKNKKVDENLVVL
jgi:hypothetical protein